MGAIHHFIKEPKNFPEDMADFSPMSRLTICSVEAGLNFCLGFKSPEPLHIPESVVSDVEAYCVRHPYWSALLDEQFTHSLHWTKEVSRLSEFVPPVVSDISLKEKLAWHFGFTCLSSLLLPVQHVNTDNYEDVCSRGGILTCLLRYFCIEALTPTASIREHDPRSFKTTEEWLNDLHERKEYATVYSAIQWDTVFSQALGNTLPTTFLESLVSKVMALPHASTKPVAPLF